MAEVLRLKTLAESKGLNECFRRFRTFLPRAARTLKQHSLGEEGEDSGGQYERWIALKRSSVGRLHWFEMNPAFDLDSYLGRIGYSGLRSPTLEMLRSIHLLHPEAIPFENLNPLLGWPVNLDSVSLQDKLVHSRRGGYCYEHNLLFRHALETIGFKVTGLAARVLWNTPQDAVLPRTHMLLRVNIDGQDYIADVGFGGLTLTAPLQLELNVQQSTPHEVYRLAGDGEEFVLQTKFADEWKSLYRFTLQEQLLPDYEMANWYVSCHPKSRFVNSLIAARAARDRRFSLLNNEFAVHYLNGRTERRSLGSASEIREVLQGPIGVPLPDAPELDAALERIGCGSDPGSGLRDNFAR